MRENDKQFFQWTSVRFTLSLGLSLQPVVRSWATRKNTSRVQSVRGAVCCLHLPSLTWESPLPVSEIVKTCTHLCGQPVDDHHELEDDDQ